VESEQIVFPIIIGICSSLVATAIFISLSELFRRLIFPWIEDKIYRGVRVDGDWTIKFKAGTKDLSRSMHLNLVQWGDKVSGTFYHQENDEKTEYRVVGTLKNMYLMAYMEPSSSRLIDACTILLHVECKGGNLLLEGSMLHKTDPGKLESWEHLVFTQENS
jgi:hypothetical protein